MQKENPIVSECWLMRTRDTKRNNLTMDVYIVCP